VKQNESTSPGTDANTNRLFGAQLSSTSFAVARAALPTGALELATVEVPTGKTATNNAGVVITATHQFTVAAGSTLPVRNSTEQAALTHCEGQMIRRLDLDRLYVSETGAWRVAGGKVPFFYGTRSSSNLASGGTPTLLTTSVVATSGMSFSSGTVTITEPGRYMVDLLVEWVEANVSGQRNIGFDTTGTARGPREAVREADALAGVTSHITSLVDITSSGQTIRPYAAHNAGTGLDIIGYGSIRWVETL
jgi:hypothetical protein